MGIGRDLKLWLRHPSVFAEKVLARMGFERDYYYLAPCGKNAEVRKSEPDVELFELNEVLEFLRSENALPDFEKAQYEDISKKGARAYGIRDQGNVAELIWVKPAELHEVPPGCAKIVESCWVLVNGRTAVHARGRGYHGITLRRVLSFLPDGHTAITSVSAWNWPSRRSVAKAGYSPYGISTWRRF